MTMFSLSGWVMPTPKLNPLPIYDASPRGLVELGLVVTAPSLTVISRDP